MKAVAQRRAFGPRRQGRKDPLKREVRLAPNEKIAKAIGAVMIEAKIKKGWEESKL